MSVPVPEWVDPRPWIDTPDRGAATAVGERDAAAIRRFARLLAPCPPAELERMAVRARALTRRHFGKTISLYVPLYLSNYCPGGCAYCGFAADRDQPRRRLEADELRDEIEALAAMGFEDVLLLTGERTPKADFEYLERCVSLAAERFHRITIESFAMDTDEYRALVDAGCTGVTLYQETYNPERYAELHRWGPKQDYHYRLEAPGRALVAGMRTVGIGALLGLSDPVYDAIALFRHALQLRRQYWRGGITISFPRIRPQTGGFQPADPVDDTDLARMIFAFRLGLPDVPLVLSTRERAAFRDGMAGLGISRMSAASRTTVGGYGGAHAETGGQFEVEDHRDIQAVCKALRARGLDPVLKNWDRALSDLTGS